MLYNWIMRRKLDPKEDTNGGVNNFTGRIKGMHVIVRNFTYAVDFMIVEDMSSIIDPRLSQVVLGKLFVKVSNMTHDPPEGVVRFTNGTNEIVYKMPHKIEQYNSLSNLGKEHTKKQLMRLRAGIFLKKQKTSSLSVRRRHLKTMRRRLDCKATPS
nr:MAK10-like protein [Tanacetum cinerariifolium]